MMGVWLTSLIYRFPIWAWKHRKTAADAAWPWSLLVPPVFVSSNCEGYVTVIESQVRWNCEFCSENPHPCGRLCLTWLLVHDFGVLTPGPMCPPWGEQLLQTTYWLDTGAFQRTKNGWAVSLSLSLQLTWKEDEIFRCLKRRGYCKGSIKNPIHFFLGENMPWGGFKLQTVMKRYCTLLWIYCVLFWTYPWFSSPFQKKSGVTLHPNISAVQEHVFGSKGNSCNLAYSKVQARRGQGRHLF